MKQILEFIPLLIFFFCYKQYDLIVATCALVVASLISFTILLLKEKKIVYMPLVSAGVLGFFGFLTWYFQDPIFIKVKPTILNSLLGLFFIIGFFLKKPILKKMLGEKISLDDNIWLKMTFNWGVFFLGLALVNEYVWRNFSENIWVNFKVFGLLGLTLSFTMLHIPYMLKNMQEDKKNG